MDSILIYQAANDLVQNTGTRNIKRIARSCSLDILETPRFKDVLGFLSLHFDKPLILINRQLDKQTKQGVVFIEQVLIVHEIDQLMGTVQHIAQFEGEHAAVPEVYISLRKLSFFCIRV